MLENESARLRMQIGEDEGRQIYQKTGGIPLALAWCLGRISHTGINVRDLLQELWDKADVSVLDYLFASTIDFLQIHNPQTLDVLLAMGVFSTSADRVALGTVSGVDEGTVLSTALKELQLMSLVKVQQQRYDVLPPTREFILAELDRRPDFASFARKRHADYFLSIASMAEASLEQGDSSLLEQEVPHFLDAIEWCIESGNDEMVISFWRALDLFLSISGRWNQALELGHQVVRIAKNRGESEVAAECLVETLGWTLYKQGRFDLAQKATMAGGKLFEQTESRRGLARAEYCLGCISHAQGRLAEAEEFFAKALVWFRDAGGDERNIAAILNEMGNLARDRRGWKTAKEHYEQSLAMFEKLTDKPATAVVSGNLANVLSELGLYSEAMVLYQRALATFEQIGWKCEWARIKWALGLQAERQGDLKTARRQISEAEKVLSEIGAASQVEQIRSDLDRVTKLLAHVES